MDEEKTSFYDNKLGYYCQIYEDEYYCNLYEAVKYRKKHNLKFTEFEILGFFENLID